MGNILQFTRCQTFMPCPKTAGPAHRALPSSRTPSRRFTYVKWGRLWLFKDILMSLGRPSGIGARFATAEALASPRSVD